ncbi:hypothetical protein SAMN05192529_10956 [Arachidicoccus rhizosphaerae]|uniref:Uncharacterized protein n=2 Tax=Arachidicoccus rhizosphaerae TaxID=551991 RepID=A0A1H3YVG0_9BACT|nr:hypothetical protein SAMN05192529_10956 [Arachidicoccus rhizosphaerae]
MGNSKKDNPEQRRIDRSTLGTMGIKCRFRQLKKQFDNWKLSILKHLERIDAGLSTRQRKWLFYLGLVCWSSWLFYLLGTAIRKPPASFVLPFTVDSSRASLRQLNNRSSGQRYIKRPQKAIPETVTDTDYSPLKLNSHD